MASLTFGLNWKHPGVLLNAGAVATDAIVQVLSYFAVSLPVGTHPYPRLLLGAIAMSWMSLYCFSASDTALGKFIGYSMAALNVAVCIGFSLVLLAYYQGPASQLWNLLLNA